MLGFETPIWAFPRGNPPPPPHAARNGDGAPVGNGKIRILVVEDEALVAMQIVGLLGEAGYEAVWSASSGPDAVAECRRWVPDLVLMDIRLRDESDGVTAAEQIRHELGIRSVFVSANVDGTTVTRARHVGLGFVRKPFDPQTLLNSVAAALRRTEGNKDDA